MSRSGESISCTMLFACEVSYWQFLDESGFRRIGPSILSAVGASRCGAGLSVHSASIKINHIKRRLCERLSSIGVALPAR